MAASKQAHTLQTQFRNAVSLVWGSLRLAPTRMHMYSIVRITYIQFLWKLLQEIYPLINILTTNLQE